MRGVWREEFEGSRRRVGFWRERNGGFWFKRWKKRGKKLVFKEGLRKRVLPGKVPQKMGGFN